MPHLLTRDSGTARVSRGAKSGPGGPGGQMTAALAAGALLLGAVGLVAAPGRADPPGRGESPRSADSPRPDLYGDPLPPDAVARMGTIRWRHRDDGNATVYAVPSPDGKLVATRNYVDRGTGSVRVWELADGRPVCAIPWDRTNTDFAFSPDGSRLLILMQSGAIRFHDPRTGKLVAESRRIDAEGPNNWPHRLTPDGRWVVTSGDKRSLMLTEIVAGPAAKRHEVRLEPHAPDFDFHRASFACDGRTLVCGDRLGGKRPLFARWDVRTGKLLGTKTIGAPSNSMCVALSPDGRRYAAWRTDVKPHDTLYVWDTETGTKLAEMAGGDRDGYGSIRFSPDGKRLAAEVKRTERAVAVKLWEVDGARAVGEATLPGWCSGYSLLADGRTILATGHGGMMFGTWDLVAGRRLSPPARHESPLRQVAFTPDGKTLLTASTDPEEQVTVWDAATGRARQALAVPHGPPHAMGPNVPFVLTPAGAVVTTGSGTLVWTDRATGRELRRVTPGPIAAAMDRADTFHQERLSVARDPHTGRPAVMALHIFGPSLFLSPEPTHRWKLTVSVWDAESGEPIAHRVEVLTHYDHTGAALSPDGRLLARPAYVSATDAALELTPALGGRTAVRLVHPGEFAPRFAFAPDGQSVVTVARKRPPADPGVAPSEANTVRVWELRTGRPRLEFAVPFEPAAVAVSPDGRLLAAARADTRTILVHDLATGAEVARRGGYRSLVETLAFRPDGRALASGHDDGTALVWDLSGLNAGTPKAADRDPAWADLASPDPARAYRAMLALAADPKAVGSLRKRVKPVPEVPAAGLRGLVKDLDADRYATRGAATAALQKLGDVADADLRTMLGRGLSAEQQRRLTAVLAGRPLTESDPDRLRALRAVEILERVGSAAPDAVLAELGKGAPGARLTREAADAAWRRGLSR